MSTKEKRIYIIECLGEKADWKSWSEKFLSHGKQERYKKLLLSSRTTSDMDEAPMKEGYENAQEDDMDANEKIIKFNELNKLAYEDLILSINTSSSVRK